jgi:hypothetical protein
MLFVCNNLSDKIHNRNASTAVQITEEAVSGCPICSRNLTFTYKVYKLSDILNIWFSRHQPAHVAIR